MNRKHLIDIGSFFIASFFVGFALCANSAVSIRADEQIPQKSMTWSLRDEFRTAAKRENPNPDRDGQTVWHFLRTTRSEGPTATRRWLRDGRYTPLAEQGDRVFGLPFDGWIYRLTPAESPVVSAALEDRAGGLSVNRGDIVVAPGPEHAVIVGWESPVSGLLDIHGSFEHSQASSGVAWYVERGPPPDTDRGVESVLLASGQLKFGTEKQRGEFAASELQVKVGDFVYFIVDALADGTPSPFTGDGTRLDVKLTVHHAELPPPPSFEKDIRPLLAAKCFDCHGGDVQEAKLDLRTLSEILRGGENGPAVVRGEPQNSLLIDLVSQGQMPPDKDDKLSPKQLLLLRRWIKAGTPADEKTVPLPPHSRITESDRDYWAFQPPRKIAEPQARSVQRVRTPIDRFLLAKLEEKGLTFSSDADRGILIRRAYLDLTGLPPEPAVVKAFLEDTRPNAYEVLIDELLKSPHYGERWGRHWLDAAGYVDGKLDNDLGSIYPNNGIWRYRDYVIQAFNDDMPYNQLLTEQLAGDELVDWRQADTFNTKTKSLLTATGFLRNVDDHTDFPQYGIEKRYEVVNETLDMFSTAVLGLTMECCRCHNHKYDPLPQRDYYRLMACFEPALNPHAWKPPKARHLADVSPKEQTAIDQRNAEIDRQVAELAESEKKTRSQIKQRVFEMRLATIPEAIRPEVKQAFELAPDKRNETQKTLVATHEKTLKVTDADVDAALTEAEKAAIKQNSDQRTALSSQKKSYGVIQALWDVGDPPVSHVHRRGNVKAHGVLVQPGFPEVLQPHATPATASTATQAAAPGVQGTTSGRRLALARWLTQPDHPLTARVFVNRVWHHHFGRGIVETLGNFGRSGSMPSHPELLDWLAVDFIEHGWSTKHLHRQILLSTAYRQTSRRPALPDQASDSDAATMSAERIDPENRLLWRMNLRRLEAEIVRDAVLAVSGSLDRTAGGPPVEITNPADGLSEAKPAPTATSPNRRSIYLFARRVYPLKFLEIFDAPIMPVNCTQRTNSATVLQSLAVLNSEFLFSQSERLATRLSETAGPTIDDQVKLSFQMVFARTPTAVELAKSLEFLDEQQRSYMSSGNPADKARATALADLCHMLLSSNEFLYVE
ncbi:MAG: PSD1 and planctomycete cytochrome C domain-containing protein [Pirellulales bacterium]